MNPGLGYYVTKFITESGLHFKISSGLFLFMLFFDPFPLTGLSFNNHIIFFAGIGAIIFLSSIFATVLISRIERKLPEDSESTPVVASYIKGLIIFFISAVASIFYLVYVGHVRINFYIAFRVILICIAPAIILEIHARMYNLRKQTRILVSEKRNAQEKIEKYEKDFPGREIEFLSENAGETLILEENEVAFIRSSGNYIEIIYKEDSGFKKKLLRNSLKNVEYQLRHYPAFIRCHRMSIVNSHFIDSLRLVNNSYYLVIRDYPERLPVSRQYLLKIRESI